MQGLKHPARHYIQYLISRRAYSTVQLIQALDLFGIATPTLQHEVEEFIEQIRPVRANMVFPSVFNPRDNAMTTATAAFLKRWRIFSAWTGDPHFGYAVDLMADPEIRHSLQLMLLGPLSVMAIATRLQQRYGLPHEAMNAGVVRAFGHYFWDRSAMTVSEWKIFLEKHYPAETFDYISVLAAPFNRAGAVFTLAVADKDLDLLAPVERYALVSAAGFRKFMEHMFNGSSTVGGTYAAYAALNIMRAGDEELSKYQGGSTDLIEHLNRIETVYDRKTPLTVREMGFVRPVLNTTAEPVEENHEPEQ